MIQGNLLKKYREQNNLTIKDLSKLMHVSKNVISLWEDGSKIPREDDIRFLCSLYNIDRIDLMEVKEKKEQPKKFNNTKYRNIMVSIILIIVSVIIGLISKSILVGTVLTFSLIVMYNSLYYLKDEKELSKNASGPKSILGISICHKERKDLVKYYSLESLTIASVYLLLSLIAYELNIEPLIINLEVFPNEISNMLFIWGSMFILLSGVILVIEIIFELIMIKNKY